MITERIVILLRRCRIYLLAPLILAISAYVIFKFFLKTEDPLAETLVLYPDEIVIKIKPRVSENFLSTKSDNIIYNSLSANKTQQQIKLRPIPEETIELKDDVNADVFAEHDIFESIDDLLKTIDQPLNYLPIEQVNEKIFKFDHGHKNHKNRYRLQLATGTSRQELERKWLEIKSNYHKYLSSYEADYQKKKDKYANFFYSLVIGHFSSVISAHEVCKKIDSEQECTIINE